MIADSPLMIYGIFRPQKYKDITIYPIACPACHAMAMHSLLATENTGNISSKGCNGAIWNVDNDHLRVIKKLFSHDTANNYQPDRERKALVALEVNEIYSPNIQSGWLAFKNNDGDMLIISSRIKGKKPDPKTNKFNSDNMSQMIDTMVYLDRAKRYWNHKKPLRHPKLSLLMHYDLKPGNILIDKKRFGVIDFEYLDFIKLFTNRTKAGKENWGILCNCSDIPELPSNLRNVEYRALLPYLEKADGQEAKKTFREYLTQKSIYHKNLAKEYTELLKKIPSIDLSTIITPTNSHRKQIKSIIESQKAHSEVLKNSNEDIIKSEAIKIQIARYIYLLSTHAHGDKTQINLEQVKNYILNAESFFAEKQELSDGAQEVYYNNSLKLLRVWKRIIPIISDGTMKSKLDYYRDISGVSNNDDCEKTMNETVFTTLPQVTLDEKVV